MHTKCRPTAVCFTFIVFKYAVILIFTLFIKLIGEKLYSKFYTCLSFCNLQTSVTTVVKYQVIAGCLSGLTEFLYVFPLDPQEEVGQRIYDYMTAVAKKRKEMNVAPRCMYRMVIFIKSLAFCQ